MFEKLQNTPGTEDLRHLKCIVILRPEDSINLLCSELSNPRYGSYYINFTNLVPKSAVKQIAEADMQVHVYLLVSLRFVETDHLYVNKF